MGVHVHKVVGSHEHECKFEVDGEEVKEGSGDLKIVRLICVGEVIEVLE